MVISVNRSPSPNPNPNSRPNRNQRNSENSPMRRSFTEKPFQRPSIQTNPRSSFPSTPANSPADLLGRNNLAMEENKNEKENQTLKPARARSPAVAKGTNHFMIPTISAASKINPSPRKKVLSDRNESISFSENTEAFDQKSDKGFISKDSEIEYKLPSPIPLLTPKTFSKSPSVKKVTFSSTVAFASLDSPNIAPPDADPSLPPYDPKTNYLSPRPQFLHYKPNPRLELSSETKNLEDNLLSESEESEPENSQKESEVIADISEKDSRDAYPIDGVITDISEDFQKGSEFITEITEKVCENATQVEVITEDASSVEEVEQVSDPEPIAEVASEGKRVAKSRFLTKRKLFSLLLIALLACFSGSLINSPILDSPVYENFSSYKFYEEGFNGFARNLKLWSVQSKSYVNELISSFSGVEKLGPVQFYNLTYTLEDPFNDVKRYGKISEPVFEDEDDEIESSVDQNLENELESEELGDDSEIDSVSSLGNTFEIETSPSVSEQVSDMEMESTVAVPSFGNTLGEDTSQADVTMKQDSTVISDSEIEDTKCESDPENTMETDAYTSDLTPEYKSTEQYKTLAMSLLATVLVAATVLFSFKNKNANITNEAKDLDPQSYSPPSEMSSFDKSYTYSKRNEIQSQERKQKRVLKREFIASSTDFSMTDSPSYGSFTTYERLPIKHGYGDDEVVTPVRRSSRIKKI